MEEANDSKEWDAMKWLYVYTTNEGKDNGMRWWKE